MRKLKKFNDAEFKVLDIVEFGTRGATVGYGCKFILQNDITDAIFECNPIGDVSTKQEYVLNKEDYFGKLVTVKFYERTKNGLPLHANVIGIRND